MLQQPGLTLEPTAVAPERAVRAHDAMARHYDVDRVAGVGMANRANCVGNAKALRQFGICHDRPCGYAAQLRPLPALKVRAAGVDGDIGKCVKLAGFVTSPTIGTKPATANSAARDRVRA